MLRRRCLLMLAAVGLGARHAWRVHGHWRRMARGVAMGDPFHMAQVRSLGMPRLAVSGARPRQHSQAALRLVRTRVDHDERGTLPDCFGIRMGLAVGDPEVEEPALQGLRALQRALRLEGAMRR